MEDRGISYLFLLRKLKRTTDAAPIPIPANRVCVRARACAAALGGREEEERNRRERDIRTHVYIWRECRGTERKRGKRGDTRERGRRRGIHLTICSPRCQRTDRWKRLRKQLRANCLYWPSFLLRSPPVRPYSRVRALFSASSAIGNGTEARARNKKRDMKKIFQSPRRISGTRVTFVHSYRNLITFGSFNFEQLECGA